MIKKETAIQPHTSYMFHIHAGHILSTIAILSNKQPQMAISIKIHCKFTFTMPHFKCSKATDD